MCIRTTLSPLLKESYQSMMDSKLMGTMASVKIPVDRPLAPLLIGSTVITSLPEARSPCVLHMSPFPGGGNSGTAIVEYLAGCGVKANLCDLRPIPN